MIPHKYINGPENISSFKYYDINEMHNIKIPQKNKSLFLFNINVCSLNKNFDNLQHLLSYTKKFQIIEINTKPQYRYFPAVNFAKFLRTPIL